MFKKFERQNAENAGATINRCSEKKHYGFFSKKSKKLKTWEESLKNMGRVTEKHENTFY